MNRARTWKLLSLTGLGSGILYMFGRHVPQYFSSPVLHARIQDDQTSPSSASDQQTVLNTGSRDELSTADMELKLVQVFFRHGARTPLRHPPKLEEEEVNYDPRFLFYKLYYTDIPFVVNSVHGGPRPPSPMDKRYKHVTFKNGVGAGQLTTLGQDQVYCLGRQLRKDYPNLMGESFDPRHVWVQSTNINRCIESLKCVLAGIYGEPTFRNKEPVVIPVSPFKEETLHPNLRSCPTLRAMEKRVRERELEIPDVEAITNKMNDILGQVGRQDLILWRDHIAARKVHGLPIPKFLLEHEEEIERGATNIFLAYMSGLPEDQPHSLRLTVGQTLLKVQKNMDQVAQQPDSQLRMCLFSCHDSTLIPLLNALNAFDGVWPPFAADLRFELWQDKKGMHWVKTKYVEKDLSVGDHQKKLVTLEDFRKILAPYVIDRKAYMEQCSLSQAFWDALDDANTDQDEDDPVPGNM